MVAMATVSNNQSAQTLNTFLYTHNKLIDVIVAAQLLAKVLSAAIVTSLVAMATSEDYCHL